MNYKKITLDTERKSFESIVAMQGDNKSRYIEATIVNRSIPVDLTGCTVKFSAIKPDITDIFNDTVISDAKGGKAQIELTNQTLAVPGVIQATLVILKEDMQLSVLPFFITVIENPYNSNAIESKSEYKALNNALTTVEGYAKELQDASVKLEEKYTTRLNNFDSQLEDIIQKRLTSNILYVDKEYGQFKEISEAIAYAKAHNVGKLYRYLIKINKGIYNEKIDMADGIDLEGVNNIDTIITYSGTGQRSDDTIFAPFDCSLKNLTVIQDSSLTTSDMQNYPIHIDGRPGEIVDYTIVLENCIFKSTGSFSHHALGAGLHGGQNIIVNNCEFQSDSKPAFFIHNWNANETKGCKVEINNSKIVGCKVNNISGNNYGLFLQDVGSGQYDEVKLYNTEIANLQNGYSIGLVKHDGFGGTRNTLIVKLIGCEYNNFYNEIDSGKIITDKDILAMSNGTIAYGKPCMINGYANNIPVVSPSQFDDSEHVLGVWIPYSGNYGGIRTQGVCDVYVDADKGAISKYDYLSTSDTGYFKKGVIGNGKCMAIALDVFASGKGYIKALLVNKI